MDTMGQTLWSGETPAGGEPGRILSISVTDKGRELCSRLPFEHRHGSPAAALAESWDSVAGFVLVIATGAAVRLVAPLLASKATDPAVVCLDEAGRFAVPICAGHRGGPGANSRIGANALARQVASLTGAQAVITTATDSTGALSLDSFPTLAAAGDVAGLTRRMLDGYSPTVGTTLVWPLPPALSAFRRAEGPDADICLTDEVGSHRPGRVLLRPPSLVAGVGTSSDTSPEEVERLLAKALDGAGLAREAVAEVATISSRAEHPAVVALGLPVRSFEAARLGSIPVPSPSAAVEAAVGTPSVAEAAALAAAGPGASLVSNKLRSPGATVAIARRRSPRGRLSVVGTGPGSAWHRSPAAEAAIRNAEAVIGYGPYVSQVADLLGPSQVASRYPIGKEHQRAEDALSEAAAGRRVALVCSGDPGVFAMAPVVLEVAERHPEWEAEIEIVPGITAGLAAAAALGAPLGHDHAVISLSDLHTPWETIAARLEAAGRSDLVVVLYNPRSAGRRHQLAEALSILGRFRAGSTPVGVVSDVARPAERRLLTTLAALDPEEVDMHCSVIVGSTRSRVVRSMMLTPRGEDHPEGRGPARREGRH